MAKVTPGEFVRQVRAETSKVSWPTRKETILTSVMVIIMATMLAIFFLGVDGLLRYIVENLLKLATGN